MHTLLDSQEEMRRDVLQRFASLFEEQVRSNRFTESIGDLVKRIHGELLAGLQTSIQEVEKLDLDASERQRLSARLGSVGARCQRLDATLDLLLRERQRRWVQSGADLKEVMLVFNRTARSLAGTLIEKDLLERQSQVLESIVLSHEKVTRWKEFVQEILSGFHTVFPFNFFFIAFSEGNSLSLYIYYLGEYGEQAKHMARTKLAEEMIGHLNLPLDAPLDIEEFQVGNREIAGEVRDSAKASLVTVAVPDLDASNLAGVLGIAHASEETLTVREVSVVRSILAIMVMVVGSSKALSRTLSELEYYSAHDPLTGLHNRRYFNEMLEYEVGRSGRHNHEFSILMLDMDDFKDVNDTYGHPCGDAVLKGVADTMHRIMRKGDLATRIGGDEFAIILTETGREGAVFVAEKIRNELRNISFESGDGKRFHITTSIGVVTYPGDAQSISDLMAGVDLGLYRAKALGKDGVGAFDTVKERIQASRENRDYAETLRDSLKQGRVIPYYQPIFDCRSGKVFAHETLARIVEPDGRTISAGMFIETIEKYGLGRDLDRTIIEQALHATRLSIDRHETPSRLFINLSAQEIQGRGIIGYAEKICDELAIPPASVVFEILERDAISDMTNMRNFLADLRKKGFLFALDDFGSGYNSFHYLRELSFDFVKIDGAFVKNILASRIDYALVRNLTHLCRDIGILTVAEFVESSDILAALKDMGVDFVQGFHLGIPTSTMHSVD
ncbi:MAG: putative bifunctional diguanylate cyclase/phosphodiesterase [Bacteroidota bacterium]